MKKILSLVLALAMLLTSASALGEGMTGGWTLNDDIAAGIPENAMTAFNAATAGLLGVGYEPVALLSTQVVSGVNYCFLCKATTVTAAPVTDWVYMYIYADLEGNASVTCIGRICIPDPERTDAEGYEITASADEETCFYDTVFHKDVHITGEGQAVRFFNCEFYGDIILESASTTNVWIHDGCEFHSGVKGIIRSGVREATIEYPLPKFMLFVPLEVESEDLGGAVAITTEDNVFDIVFNGVTYTTDDVTLFADETGFTEYDGETPISIFAASHWWENGEEQLFCYCV